MRYTLFETDTVFDLSALDTSGMSAKPNSDNPIGYFGTGLKYAIAILLREGAKLDLYCNGDHYTFYTKERNFRGSVFHEVMYRRQNLKLTSRRKYVKLGFVTDLGKNWQLWQAFRELYSNTLDESGRCFSLDQDSYDNYGLDVSQKVLDGKTLIVVEHFEFANLVERKGDIFLDPRRETVVDCDDGNVSDKPSKHLYFRGMRALDLPDEEEALFTYNVMTPLELTEDRTIKSLYTVKGAIESIVSRSDNAQFIKQVLMAPEKTFESNLNFQYEYGASKTFREVVTALRDEKSLNRSARAFYGSYISPPKRSRVDDAQWGLITAALDDGMVLVQAAIDNAANPTAEDTRNIYLETLREALDR